MSKPNQQSAVNSRLLQFSVNTTAEQSEEYGKVLCSVRGVSKEAAANMKSFQLDLGAFGGEIPEQHDGLAVEVCFSADDQQTEKYLIPANFKVIEIVPGAYKPRREKVDLDEFLKSIGI